MFHDILADKISKHGEIADNKFIGAYKIFADQIIEEIWGATGLLHTIPMDYYEINLLPVPMTSRWQEQRSSWQLTQHRIAENCHVILD